MPVFKYKAVTKTGQIVENRVDATNQYTLMKKYKKVYHQNPVLQAK